MTVDRDDSKRGAQIPPELEAELKANPEAAAAFAKLSYSHQREHINYVAEAKKPETRERRALRTVMSLRAQEIGKAMSTAGSSSGTESQSAK